LSGLDVNNFSHICVGEGGFSNDVLCSDKQVLGVVSVGGCGAVDDGGDFSKMPIW
jgi:hypothetical protein